MRVFEGLRIVGLLTLVLLLKCLHCSHLSLYECPCQGDKCTVDKSPWTNFIYEISENEIENVTVSLKHGNDRMCEFGPSEEISVDLSHPNNTYGYHGQLHGVKNRRENVSFEIDGKGVLFLPSYVQGVEQFTKQSYCIQRENVTHSLLKICCGALEKSCIRKCCPHGYAFTNNDSSTCVEYEGDAWDVPVMMSSLKGREDASLKIRTGFPECEMLPYNISTVLSTSLTKFNIPRQPFRLYGDGTLKYLPGAGSGWKLKPQNADYCVDQLVVAKTDSDLTCGVEEQDVLIMCSEAYAKKEKKNDWIYRVVYMSGFVISIVVLLATAVVHFLLWEKQNSHAWTILCYVLSLTLFYTCLLTIHVEEMRKRLSSFSDTFIPLFPKQLCFALGVTTHFLGIFSFAWLSVINFDLWWTFRVLKPMHQRNLDLKRLFCYASFAFAIPTAVVSIAYGFQISYERGSEPCRKTEEDATVYPRYGEESCFLANSSQAFYFYVPVGILLLANLIFYLCTSCQMLRIYNATRRISSDRSSKNQKQSCELFLKLFLVMGTTWIFQVILSVVENDEEYWYSPVFAVVDLVNMFQAIAIFVIFVCKRETLRALEHKYACLKACLRGVYKTPTIISRSTDGSTKISRTDFSKGHVDGVSDHPRDSELISFA